MVFGTNFGFRHETVDRSQFFLSIRERVFGNLTAVGHSCDMLGTIPSLLESKRRKIRRLRPVR